MVVIPLVHFPCPSKVIAGIIDDFPMSVLRLNVVEPDLIDLEGASVMSIPLRVTFDHILTAGLTPDLPEQFGKKFP